MLQNKRHQTIININLPELVKTVSVGTRVEVENEVFK